MMEDQGTQTAKRRSPHQARSRDKLELIFEATTRILNKQGLDGLTTNRIAEVAGVSIGTLYQYFSNKQEILVALGEREVQSAFEKITKTLLQPNDEKDKLPLLIRVFLNAFEGRNHVRKILLDIMLANRGLAGLDQPVARVIKFMNSPLGAHMFVNVHQLSEIDTFVLASSVTGIIRSALARDIDMLNNRELEDKILILIRSYINQVRSGALNAAPSTQTLP